MANTVVKSVRDYLLDFPEIGDRSKLNIEYLPPDSVHHSISEVPSPTGGVLYTEITGDLMREATFAFFTRFDYEERIAQNIENSGFNERFVDWIISNNKKKVFPEFPEGKTVERMSVVSTPSLFLVGDDQQTAEYTFTIRFEYRQKEN